MERAKMQNLNPKVGEEGVHVDPEFGNKNKNKGKKGKKKNVDIDSDQNSKQLKEIYHQSFMDFIYN